MSKRQVTCNVPLAACAAIFLLLASQFRPQPRIPPRRGSFRKKRCTMPPHAVNRVVLQTEPEAACNLHVAGDNDPAKTMTLYANDEVRPVSLPPRTRKPRMSPCNSTAPLPAQ